MATVYNLNIKTVSAFSKYPEEEVCKIIKNLIDNYKHPETGLGFESTEISIRSENTIIHNKRHYNPMGQGYSGEPKKPKLNGCQVIQDGNGTFCKKCGSTMEKKYNILGFSFGKILHCHNPNCGCAEEENE